MTSRSTPVRPRRLLAALTALLIGISGSVALASPSVAETSAAVSVTPSTDIDTAAANSLSVSGTGFVEAVTVALVTEADWTTNGPASTQLITVAPGLVEGAFTAVLDIPAGTLDPATAYGVATFSGTESTLTPIALTVPEQEAPTEDVPAEDLPAEAPAEVPTTEEPATRAREVASTVAAGNVTGGTAAWGLSAYLNSFNPGRPNPLASAYTAPASFDASTLLSSWGSATGTVNPDGSAQLAFAGSSVNFAPTGGGWLRLSDLEATLDASGNGSVSAVVEYGTAVGTNPIPFDPAQVPARGPERVTLVTLAGNTAPAVQDEDSASWAALAGTWSTDFTSFLAGSAPSIPGWSYASTVNGNAGRTPLAFAFSVELEPEVVVIPTTYDEGSAVWGLSTYLNSANPGRPNPLPSAYVAPASFDATSRLTTWGGGSGTVNADGTATISYRGASVNFAPTGGGWLKLADVQATLDAAGNGSVTALVSYGTAVGTNPITYDPAQTPARGPQRMTVVTLAGNAVPVAQGADTAAWSNLGGTWSSEFTSFLAGSAPSIPGWSYASTVSGVSGRTPLAFTFDLGIAPPPPAVTTTLALRAAPTTDVVQGTTVTLTATVSPAAAGTVEFRNGSTSLGTSAVTAGAATLALPGLAVGSYSAKAYFTPADASAFTASQSAVLPLSVTAPVVAQAGSLIWGVKSSLKSYVLGGGSISTSAGAGSYGSSFLFPQQSSSAFNQSTGTGTSAYRGAVTFSYPAHGFSIALSNPRVQVDSATVGSLIVDVTFNGTTTSGVTFATLFLGAASKSSSAVSTTFTGAPAALTSAGAATFQGFYSTGEVLDPITFVVGSPAASFEPSTASAPEPRAAASTPPSTTGITLTTGANPVAGDEITMTADGFEPNEEGILVVIYSEPTVLDKNAKADANGTLTWTGRLPAGLTGKHTLTFQGSVNRGVEVEIAPRIATAAEGCPVDAATLTWGFKESFRSYISGSIANGEWIVADGATYATPEFGWSGGKGAYDAEGGLVAFTGSVEFTGHGGILDTTIANPQLRFVDADTAVLVLDVSGTTQDGAAVDQQDVEFVDIDLSGALENADGTITVTAAPTVLTPAGAAAFGTYEAGEPFDAVSFTLPLDSACAAPVVEPSETATVTAEPVASGSDLTWLWILLVAVLLLIIAALVVIVTRRRTAG
ncbi:hypothetical protein BH11ACT5_BH11ACT5_08460 [soil metagenome]